MARATVLSANMADLTSWLETQVQEWWADESSFPPAPSNIYVALHTGDPGEDASNDEVDASDYSRAETAPGDWTVSGDGPTTAENDNEIQFDAAENDWGDVSHVSLWTDTADNDGDPLWQGSLGDTRSIQTDDRAVIPAGEISTDLD